MENNNPRAKHSAAQPQLGSHSRPYSQDKHSSDAPPSSYNASNNKSVPHSTVTHSSIESHAARYNYTGSSPRSGQHQSAVIPASENLVRVKKKKPSHKGLKIFAGIMGSIFGVIVLCAAALGLWINSLNSDMNDFSEEDRQALLDKLAPTSATLDNSAFYVAILGSDARDGDTASRSDVFMLARIDPDKGIVDLVSIPRDTMVNIEGHGLQKINAAFAFGGAAGAVECMSEFAGVPISHYVEVHFSELERVVDLLGGIWIDIPESFSAGNGGMSFTEGEQLLNGEQALAFARERYNVSGGDFGRAQAQRLIIEGIVEKVLECSPTQLPNVVGSLVHCVTTDYTVSDMVSLALDFQSSGLTMYSTACPSYSLSQDGVSYVGTMYDEWQDMMRRVDAGLDPNDESATIPEPQASNTTLGAANNAASPRDYDELAAHAGLTTNDVAK